VNMRKMTHQGCCKVSAQRGTLSKSDLSEDPLFKIQPTKFKVKIRADYFG
jgi:hypothetical protein